MLGHKGNRHNDNCLVLRTSTLDLVLGRWADPFHRAHAALIADIPVQPLDRHFLDHGGRCFFDLRLIGITALGNHRFWHTMGRKQDARLINAKLLGLGTCAFITRLDHLGGGLNKARIGRIAARCLDRGCQANLGTGPFPVLDRRSAGGSRKLRIKRQQNLFICPPCLDRGCGIIGKRLPIAHGDKTTVFITVIFTIERCLQGIGLLLGQFQKRRFATDMIINLARNRRTATRNQLGQQEPERIGQADDRRIVKQVEQKRLNGCRTVRTTQIEKNNGAFLARRFGHLAILHGTACFNRFPTNRNICKSVALRGLFWSNRSPAQQT